jgi:hypothetical protein
VVLALWFYLAGWRKRDTVRTTAAFVALAAGLLTHYSAGPYVAILTLHYLIRVFPRRENKWRELAGIASICGLLVGVWLAWSLAVYGPRVTFASNTSVTDSRQYAGSTVGKIAANLYDSIVPAVVRNPALLDEFDGQRDEGIIRDDWFVFYQVNLIFGMGLVGGPLVLWLVYRALRWKREAPAAGPGVQPEGTAQVAAAIATSPERGFWRVLIAAGVLVGIAVVGQRDLLGVTHATLLSLQALGLSMLAAVLPWRRGILTAVILAGCAVDFSCGVLLQAHVESLDNTAGSTVFPNAELAGNAVHSALPGPDALSQSAWSNWFVKHRFAVANPWLSNLGQRYVEAAIADDAANWQGWFAHHGGEVVFLGDHVAGWFGAATSVAEALLVALFLGLAGGVYRRCDHSTAETPRHGEILKKS